VRSVGASERASFFEEGGPPPRDGRAYVGDEFCDRLLPSPASLDKALAALSGSGIGLTLVTAYLSNKGIQRLEAALEFLAGRGLDGVEVVVNDWGALHLIEERFPERFQVVLGRLLVNQSAAFHHVMPDTLLEMAARRDIRRLEFNTCASLAVNLPRLSELGLKGHVYFPFQYLATTRYCLFANGPGACPRDAIASCGRECAGRRAVMEIEGSDRGAILVKGNTCFLDQRARAEERCLAADRVVDNGHLCAEQ
jgi:hypothetical protein